MIYIYFGRCLFLQKEAFFFFANFSFWMVFKLMIYILFWWFKLMIYMPPKPCVLFFQNMVETYDLHQFWWAWTYDRHVLVDFPFSCFRYYCLFYSWNFSLLPIIVFFILCVFLPFSSFLLPLLLWSRERKRKIRRRKKGRKKRQRGRKRKRKKERRTRKEYLEDVFLVFLFFVLGHLVLSVCWFGGLLSHSSILNPSSFNVCLFSVWWLCLLLLFCPDTHHPPNLVVSFLLSMLHLPPPLSTYLHICVCVVWWLFLPLLFSILLPQPPLSPFSESISLFFSYVVILDLSGWDVVALDLPCGDYQCTCRPLLGPQVDQEPSSISIIAGALL